MTKTNVLKMILVVCGFGLCLSSASAATYDLVDFPISYSGASLIKGSLEASQVGQFTTEQSIEDFLNASTYSVNFYDGNNQLFSLNNANASWDLRFSYESGAQTTGASLTATASEIILNFSTPRQPTSVSLLLGSPTTGYIQYRQDNNVTDANYFGADFNAVHQASSSLNYQSPFVFTSAVPEPSAALLLVAGLGIVGFNRKSTK